MALNRSYIRHLIIWNSRGCCTVLLTLLKLPVDTSEFIDNISIHTKWIIFTSRNMIHLVHIHCLFIIYSAFCLGMKHKSTSWSLSWVHSPWQTWIATLYFLPISLLINLFCWQYNDYLRLNILISEPFLLKLTHVHTL